MTGKKPLSRSKFLALIKNEATKRYPDRHPFNTLLYEGKLNKTQIHGWINNWFYYQNMIPLKDGAVISSGHTSLNGRPHAEHNALNKRKNFNR